MSSYPPQGTVAGITKLSELTIDVSKDWLAYLTKNVGAAVDDNDAVRKVQAILQAVLTTHGDILYKGDFVADRLAPGIAGQYLKTLGSGAAPAWDDLPGARFERMFFLTIPAPEVSVAVAEDHSGGGHTATPPALSIPTPTVGKATAVTGVNACGGAVAHDDDGVDTDETAEANSAAINDMTLLQPDGAAPDWYALGYASKFDAVCINVGTAGGGITLDTFEYSRGGGAWGTLTVILNQLNNWETTSKVWFTFERPADWATDTYAGIANMYWIKFKSSAVGVYTQPKGTQAWILVY